MKRALKKWVLQPISVGEAGHFRGHLAEVVALSSSGDCGATFPLGLIGGVAVGNVHLSVAPPAPAGSILVMKKVRGF